MLIDGYDLILIIGCAAVFVVGVVIGRQTAPQSDCPPPDPQPVKLLNLTMSEDGRRITYEFEGVESVFALNENETAWVDVTPSDRATGQG